MVDEVDGTVDVDVELVVLVDGMVVVVDVVLVDVVVVLVDVVEVLLMLDVVVGGLVVVVGGVVVVGVVVVLEVVVEVVDVVVVVGGVSTKGMKITIGRYRCGFVQASRRMLRALFEIVICTEPNSSRQGSGWA